MKLSILTLVFVYGTASAALGDDVSFLRGRKATEGCGPCSHEVCASELNACPHTNPFVCLEGKAQSGCTAIESIWLNPEDCHECCDLSHCPEEPARECFVIDFETDGQGAHLVFDRTDNDSGFVENEWNNYCGVVLSAEGGVRSLPRLFDSANPLLDPSKPKGCGDPDLGAPNENCPGGGPGVGDGGAPGQEGENCVPLGNILIVQEEKSNGVVNNCPDDNVGGNITFHFGEYVEHVSLEALDVEEAGNDPSREANTRVEITYSDNALKVYELEPFGDNSKQKYDVLPNEDDGNDQIKKVKVDFTGSGGIPSISFCCKKH